MDNTVTPTYRRLSMHHRIFCGSVLFLIKHLVISVGFILFFSTVYAQQNNSFYYFGSTKVYVSPSSEKIYVRTQEGVLENRKRTLQDDFQLPENSFSTLDPANLMVISLKDLDQNKYSKLVSDLDKTDDIETFGPVFIAPGGKEIVIDENFYVKLKQGFSYPELKDFASQNNCILNDTPYKYDNNVYFLKAGIVNDFDGLRLANLFYESGLFEYSEPDFITLDILNSTPPNDNLFSSQWGAKNTGSFLQRSGTPGADIDLLDAWDITMGSSQIKIAVLDDGIDRSHPDLINNILPIGFGLEPSNANTGDILNSSNSHGTSCAGIIAAEANNGIGIAGVAPNCKLIPVNVWKNIGGTISVSELTSAFDWSWDEGGADVLSNSWSIGSSSSFVNDAIYRAVTLGRNGKGSVVVFSSGNNNGAVSYPAIYSEAIAVGAVSMCYERKSSISCDGEYWWGGNYGIGLDISAPGVKIPSTTNTGYTLAFNGTSSAAPFVSGVAALVLSVNNNLTQSQVRGIIEGTAKKVGSYSYSLVPGQPNGSWSSELGHGMVNAKDAVIAALNMGSLTGNVSWNSNCSERDATVKLYEPGTTTEIASYDVSIQSDGSFTIPELEIGTFDVVVKVTGYLAKGTRNVEIAAGNNSLQMGTIRFGDLNGDNVVNFIDAGALSQAYFTSAGNPHYNPFADFDCTGAINFSDAGALSISYFIAGETAPLEDPQPDN